MDTLRMRSCCCMSLKTAGIIVASIELILAIGSMVLVPVLMISIFDVIANILWLYGLYVQNHRLLLPSMMVMTILCLWSVIIPVMSLGFYELSLYRRTYMAIFISIGTWCVVALFAFIWILKYSIYKEMVASTHGSHIDSNC